MKQHKKLGLARTRLYVLNMRTGARQGPAHLVEDAVRLIANSGNQYIVRLYDVMGVVAGERCEIHYVCPERMANVVGYRIVRMMKACKKAARRARSNR